MKTADKKQQTASPLALITGASSGLGLELAKLFAADGNDLFITSKSIADLNKVGAKLTQEFGVRVWEKEVDLAEPLASRELYDYAASQSLNVETLVNSAGLGLYGKFSEHPLSEERELLNVNINALTELCHLFLPAMVKNGGGKILNIASIAAFQAGPYYATYFASKAYVLLFSEALHYEYAADNISITALCPGVTRTAFFKRANMREDSKMLQGNLMDPTEVAKIGYKALLQNKRMVIPGTKNKLVGIGYRILPRSVVIKITRNAITKAAG